MAFVCLQPYGELRPPMSEVVAMLTCKAEVATKPMKPAFIERRYRKEAENPSSWDSISAALPSPLQSDSPGMPPQPNWSHLVSFKWHIHSHMCVIQTVR